MLELKNITYTIYENDKKKHILEDVNLSFQDKRTYVITGPNGSGKTTLAKIIMGIVAPTSGRILLNGEDISHLTIDERAKKGLSYAFQIPVTFKGLKVCDLMNIACGEKNNVASLCEYLSMVGMCARDYINRPLDNKLSGGELKRIELAMMMARKGKVNIFDEPEAGIDLWSFENLSKIFSSLKLSTNIIISHQRKIIEVADQVIVLKNGKVEEIGEGKSFINNIEQMKCGKLRGEND